MGDAWLFLSQFKVLLAFFLALPWAPWNSSKLA